MDQCQCILLCVRILLANLPPFSTTSETLSYSPDDKVVVLQSGEKTALAIAILVSQTLYFTLVIEVRSYDMPNTLLQNCT